MLDLAERRAVGVITYLTTAAHTRGARAQLRDRHLSVHVPVTAPAEAARAHLATYLALENYRASFLRQGFDEADLTDGGSDRLLAALNMIGGARAVRAAIDEPRDAGVDHVCLQPLDEPATTLLIRETGRLLG